MMVQADSPELKQLLSETILEFNTNVGARIIQLTSDASQANSFLNVRSGIEHTDGKVGWGQWVKSTHVDGFLSAPFEKRTKTFTYTMNIDLDKEFVTLNADRNDPSKKYNIRKLVTHEIGHGLSLGHTEKQSDVMFPSINGDKDFDAFYKQAFQAYEQNDC